MRALLTTEQFKRDVRRLHKKHYALEKLTFITETLRIKGTPPTASSPHKLHGEWSGYWECHIEQDWLLIYQADANFVYLYRTGSHDELF